MGSRTLFSELMGSVEPIEPMLTPPLHMMVGSNPAKTNKKWRQIQACLYHVEGHLQIKSLK